VWLWEAGALGGPADVVRLRAEQGDFMGRPGRLAVELHVAGGRPARVRVGGEAVTVLSGRLRAA
jgi:predicted PhzF superfamily epimerase YddE/YHI9